MVRPVSDSFRTFSETLQAYDDALSAKRKKLKPNEFICGICDRISEKTEPYYADSSYADGHVICNGCFLAYVKIEGRA